MRHGAARTLSRRTVLSAGGVLIVGFSLQPRRALAQGPGGTGPQPPPRGSLAVTPWLDSWIRIASDGLVTVFTGKAELGQGIKTALIQLAAEELAVEPASLHLVTADTALTPNEGYTAGSHSMQDSGTAIMNAAAQAHAILRERAAKQWQIPSERVTAHGGAMVSDDGRRLDYGTLVSDEMLHVQVEPQPDVLHQRSYQFIGKSVPRVDIVPKLTGVAAYVQDMRPDGMVHARTIWPPSYGARLRNVDSATVEKMPGVLKVVRDGNYLAVIAEREYQAIAAQNVLADAAQWDETVGLPDQANIFDHLAALPAQQIVVRDDLSPSPFGGHIVTARYRRAYQIHGSIGPSCAIGRFQGGMLTVWTHSQGVYPLRGALAQLTGLPQDQVRCIHVEGSGCYGHNGADDVAADAALLAIAMPGRPVRVQWMREQEHIWEPYGPAMLTEMHASLDNGGKITSWNYTVRGCTHSTRPGPAGNLMAAWLRAHPLPQPAPKPIPLPEGGGDRNAEPLYRIPNARILYEFIPAMPLRVSALRGLGAYMNVFSIESFMDELARAAHADPVTFRLQHLDDPRARDVVSAAAAHFGWQNYKRQPDRGRGFGFARYKNLAAYAAVAVEVSLDRETGRTRLRRAIAAVDSGTVVNPDGIRNQMEGGILQSASWTLYEQVTFDRTRITSRDWSSYPIMRFSEVPEVVEVHILDRPGEPFLGTGEAAQGPTAGAIANAIADATGVRIRELPFTADKIKNVTDA